MCGVRARSFFPVVCTVLRIGAVEKLSDSCSSVTDASLAVVAHRLVPRFALFSPHKHSHLLGHRATVHTHMFRGPATSTVSRTGSHMSVKLVTTSQQRNRLMRATHSRRRRATALLPVLALVAILSSTPHTLATWQRPIAVPGASADGLVGVLLRHDGAGTPPRHRHPRQQQQQQQDMYTVGRNRRYLMDAGAGADAAGEEQFEEGDGAAEEPAAGTATITTTSTVTASSAPVEVATALDLQAAVASGTPHIRIVEHLDLTALSLVDGSILGSVPETVQSILVRAFNTSCF